MLKKLRLSIPKSLLAKTLSIVSLTLPLCYSSTFNEVKAGIEFQWDSDSNFKKLNGIKRIQGDRTEIRHTFSLDQVIGNLDYLK